MSSDTPGPAGAPTASARPLESAQLVWNRAVELAGPPAVHDGINSALELLAVAHQDPATMAHALMIGHREMLDGYRDDAVAIAIAAAKILGDAITFLGVKPRAREVAHPDARKQPAPSAALVDAHNEDDVAIRVVNFVTAPTPNADRAGDPVPAEFTAPSPVAAPVGRRVEVHNTANGQAHCDVSHDAVGRALAAVAAEITATGPR